MTGKDDIPEWVEDEIQNAKFRKPQKLKRTGYILEIYDTDNKIDAQLYDAIEDGRHIITMDLGKNKTDQLERGVVYEFVFNQHKAPLSKEVTEYLATEKGIEMEAIYQFELKSLEELDMESESVDDE